MKIRRPDLTPSPVNEEHRSLGIPPAEETAMHPGPHPLLRIAVGFAILVLLGAGLLFIGQLFFPNNWEGGIATIQQALGSSSFWAAAGVGFFAQAIDGALGMAYGITATSFLLGAGATPAVASASVHIAEVFTTGFSGISHVRYGNVNRDLFVRLLVPGILGAVTGVIVVTRFEGEILKPIISGYLLIMGLYILGKARHQRRVRMEEPRHVGKLALFGGFVDAVGGGGWGPVVTTTLVGSGNDPRTTIGSVNFAEFFLTLTVAASFSLLVTTTAWVTIAGLVFGGIFAAPFAAILCKRLQARTLLVLVGSLISVLSLYNLYRALA